MNEYFIFGALFLTILLESSYLFFIQYISSKTQRKNIRIANTFMYEATPKFNENTAFVNYVLLFAVIINFFPYIYYLFYHVEGYAISMMVIATILLFTMCFIPFIGLNKLKEHLYLDVTSLILLAALFGIEAISSLTTYRTYLSNYYLAAMIVALVLFAFTLFLIINPKLFDLKNNVDGSGNVSRKKVIWLAVTEWLLYPLATLSLIPLLLLSIK